MAKTFEPQRSRKNPKVGGWDWTDRQRLSPADAGRVDATEALRKAKEVVKAPVRASKKKQELQTD